MGEQKQVVSPYLRFLFGLPKGHIFTTRDLLPFARRTTIDSALSRMVRGGLLERLARGVFRFYDSNNKKVTVKQIAAIKRRAFGRKIATVANNIRRECLPRLNDRGKELLRPSKETHATDGRTSSFFMHTNCWRINLKSVSPRILALGESVAGKAMRDLWLIGNKDITLLDVREVWADLKPRDKAKVPALKKLLPQWLTELLPPTPVHALEALMIRPPRRPVFIKPRKKTEDTDLTALKAEPKTDNADVEDDTKEIKEQDLESLKNKSSRQTEDSKEDRNKGVDKLLNKDLEEPLDESAEAHLDEHLDDYDCH